MKAGDGEYAALQSATGWDGNNDIAINGKKYRRMLRGDATYYDTIEGCYNWEDGTTYHYFRYEPVKWRVLRTDGNSAMLLSDMILDDRRYATYDGIDGVRNVYDVTWEISTIRSWLNGYGADRNYEGISYSSGSFINSAFKAEEKSAIADTEVVNSDSLTFKTEGGNDTTDKIFLLSESEVYTDAATEYGFSQDWVTYDEARRCKGSDYAKSMGAESDDASDGNCYWWLRSPAATPNGAAGVDCFGHILDDWGGLNAEDDYIGMRVALNLNLSSSNLYTYAGMVCSDGTVSDSGEPPTKQPDTEAPKVTYSNETVSVKDDKEAYSFFTTSKVSRTVSKTGTVKTTIPAANKWEVTNGGTVDVSPYSGGKTLYFAKSTTPAYDDIITVVVPAQPKFTSIGYNPAGKSDSTIELLKMPKMKIKKKAGGTETITFQDGDEARIQYRRKDTEDFRNGIDFSGDLPTIQKSGAAIEIRTTSAGVTEAVKEDKGAYCFSSAEVLPSLNANADIYEAGTFLRPGIVKIVKIAKRAAAPAAKDEVIYFKDKQVYMVRTAAKAGKSPKAASLPVFIIAGTTKSFADAYGTDNKVTVKGGSKDTKHIMTISREVVKGSADEDASVTKMNNPARSYQYAIVADASAYINLDGTLNYKKLDDDKKTVKWSSATIKAGSESVSVTLKDTKNVKIAGKQVILRAANGTNILSSKAVILTAPTDTVDNWTQKAAGETNIRSCLNINSTADYDAATRTFRISAGGAKESADGKTVTMKVSQGSGKSKKSQDIPGTVTVTGGNAVISVCIKDKGFSESDSLKLSITVPANTLTGMDGAGNAEQTLSKTVDTKAPVITECELLDNNKLRLAIDSPVQFGTGDDKITLAATGNVAGCAKFVKIYTVGTGEDTLVTDADFKVVLEGLTDAAGNPLKLKSGFTSKTVTAAEGTGSISFRFEAPKDEQRAVPSAAPAA